MKRNIFAITALFAAGSLLFTGCTKEDTTAPVITLLGDNPYEMPIGGTYTEPGFTAEDDEDGDLTSEVVVDNSDIDANLKGSYEVHYTVSDAAGNVADEHREVEVINEADPLEGNYSVKDTCDGIPYAYSQVVTTSSTVNKRFGFSKFADYNNNTNIYANLNGVNIDLPNQTATSIGTLNENHSFQGTGYTYSNGFYLGYTDTNISQGGATANCKAWFNKQ